MILTQEHLSVLKELAKGRLTVRTLAPEVCTDLQETGCATITPSDTDLLVIEITEEGQRRIAAAA